MRQLDEHKAQSKPGKSSMAPTRISFQNGASTVLRTSYCLLLWPTGCVASKAGRIRAKQTLAP